MRKASPATSFAWDGETILGEVTVDSDASVVARSVCKSARDIVR